MRENPPFSDLPPGVRIVAGKPAIHDLDRLNDFNAVLAKLDYERADLTVLTDEQLVGLSYKGIRLAAISAHRDCGLFERVSVERVRREEASQRVSARVGRAA